MSGPIWPEPMTATLVRVRPWWVKVMVDPGAKWVEDRSAGALRREVRRRTQGAAAVPWPGWREADAAARYLPASAGTGFFGVSAAVTAAWSSAVSLTPALASIALTITAILSPMPMVPLTSLPSAPTTAVAGYMPMPKPVLVTFTVHALP